MLPFLIPFHPNGMFRMFRGVQAVFRSLAEDLVDTVMEAGHNACVLAYGQTGSGKTHSMFGSREDPGLIPRLCKLIWARCASKRAAGLDFSVEISMLEIYNEEIFDLLGDEAGEQQRHGEARAKREKGNPVVLRGGGLCCPLSHVHH